MQTTEQQAPSHPAAEASSAELPPSGSQLITQHSPLSTPRDDPRLSLPRPIAYRCCEKIQRQAREILEAVAVSARAYYDDSTGTYPGKEFTPERAAAMFEQTHAMLVNVAQGAAGVYAAAGLEVPPEIDWAARGALPPSALPSPSLKPQASPLSSPQSATPTDAGLSPAANDTAARSLPGAAA